MEPKLPLESVYFLKFHDSTIAIPWFIPIFPEQQLET